MPRPGIGPVVLAAQLLGGSYSASGVSYAEPECYPTEGLGFLCSIWEICPIWIILMRSRELERDSGIRFTSPEIMTHDATCL